MEQPSILVVDDDADIVAALTVVLEGSGYRVLTAGNGAEALAQLRDGSRPSLILLDLMMPVINAWEFRREQLRDPALATLPVIVMTGFDQVAGDAASLGAVEFLRKPIELDTLLKVIERARRPS